MDLRDMLEIVGKVGPVVVGLATIAGAFLWLVKLTRKLRRAATRAKKAEKEREEALKAKEDAERKRNEAQQELVDTRKKTKEEKDRADRYFKDGMNLKGQVAELGTSLATANEKVKEQQKNLERYEARLASVAECGGRVWQVPIIVKRPEFVPLQKRRTRIISVVNLKGGVGKTTITANLGGYLAKHLKKRVLLIDLDHQRSLTQLLFSTEQRTSAAISRRTIQDFLLSTRSGSSFRAVAQQLSGLDLCSLIGNSDSEQGYGTRQNLDDLEMEFLCKWLVNPASDDVRFLMQPALHSEEVCGVSKGFDYVLLDCPPRLTTACVNALAASDFVLIPAQAEPMSARSVPHLLRRLRELCDAQVLPDLKVLGVVANMVSPKVDDIASKEARVLRGIEGLALKAWGSPVNLFKAKLRDSEFYASAPRKLEEANKLSFAVDVEAVRLQYELLMKEIEEVIERHIHEHRGVASVSS